MRLERERWLTVELRHLAALEGIAREGSFGQAASQLGYVQSAISQQLAQLECLAGTRLVDRARGGGPVVLTSAGRLLLEHAETVFARVACAREELAALADGRAGSVRLGALDGVAARVVLPHVLPRFAQSFPDVRVALTEARTREPLLALLERGELDLALCELPLPDGPLDQIELLDDPYVLLVAHDSPLAARDDAPPLAEVARMPLIGVEDQEPLRAALAHRGHELELAQRTELDATTQALVANGLGVAIMPLLAVDPLDPGTAMLELPELAPRTLGLAWRGERELSPAVRRLFDAIRATCGRRFRRAARAA